ncbi:MAG: glycosyltransferase [Desulfovibrionaceae bacterium]
MTQDPRIAVCIPCYNESTTIATVIQDFRRFLPDAAIYVYDNNSTDGTSAIALANHALVRQEPLQGKGNVVRRMFADIDADVYVMVDGDATYDASAAPLLVHAVWDEQKDMVVACRDATSTQAYRRGHTLGNRIFTKTIALIFGRAFTDILSGYRAFSRRFVKSFPAHTTGFETETELTVHALQLCVAIGEIRTVYAERPHGSVSKLSTYRDGYRIAKQILSLVLSERPMLLFGPLASLSALGAVVLFLPILSTYWQDGLVPRFPSLIVASSLGVLSVLACFFGYLFDRIALTRREIKRFFYLSQG